MLIITSDTHLDHALTSDHIDWLLRQFKDKTAFFAETVQMPLSLSALPCALHGPAMGDAPVRDVTYKQRGERQWVSRMCYRKPRLSHRMTVIGGPVAKEPDLLQVDMVLFTAFGGPLAPQEPGDPNCKDLTASVYFWS